MTIKIGIAYPTDPIYEDISRFAREVYGERLHVTIRGTPDLFVYAQSESRILGCVGLTRARVDRQLLFEVHIPDAFERLCGHTADRTIFAEIGTRAVHMPEDMRSKSGMVSLGLCARVLHEAHTIGIQCVCLTSNRMVRAIARELHVSLIELGEPDFYRIEESLRKDWKNFFRVKQYCFGCMLRTSTGCLQTLERLTAFGIRT